MNVYTRWWLCHYVKCQTRKTPRLTIRWPIISMPLPEGPGVAIRVDYFGPLPVTPRGNTYILLITDRFSRRADVFPVTASEITAESTANVLVDKYFPLWGCPCTVLSDNGLQFCSELSQAVYQLLGARKLAARSDHPNGNVGIERLWPECWLWSSTRNKTTGICRSLTSSSLMTIQSTRQRVERPTRFTWVDFHVPP